MCLEKLSEMFEAQFVRTHRSLVPFADDAFDPVQDLRRQPHQDLVFTALTVDLQNVTSPDSIVLENLRESNAVNNVFSRITAVGQAVSPIAN